MKTIRSGLFLCIFSCITTLVLAQVPNANFSISPTPACAGQTVVLKDLSTGNATAWSYTVRGNGPGTNSMFPVQNPTITIPAPGIYTIALVASNSNGSSNVTTKTLQVIPGPNAFITPPTANTCLGGAPVTLSVISQGPGSAGFTYSWSIGAIGSSILVSPNVTTTYFCAITSSNGCTVVRSSTVTVGAPTVNINSNPFNICPGSSVTLNVQAQAPAPFSYTWSTAANTPTISTNQAGVYSVSVTNASGCVGTQSINLISSATLSMNATATPSLLCAGMSATLRALGASSYTWSSGSNNPNTMVMPQTTTTYTVYGSSGTCTGLATVTIGVTQMPSITIVASSTALCSGKSATLTANGATTYTWFPGGNNTFNMIVTPSLSTTYSVSGNNPGCPNRTGTLAVAVLQSPVISVSSNTDITCPFEVVALAASGGSTYLWNDGSTANVVLVTPSVTTSYSVIGTAANSCTNSASITQSVDICEGIGELSAFSKNNLNIYPNPGNGIFNLRTDSDMQLLLFNSIGKQIMELELKGNSEYNLDLKTYPSGLYFIRSKNSDRILSKLVLQN